ncbi:MAG: hypothetical protein AAGE80_05990 [Pseudomonadota bacterium]
MRLKSIRNVIAALAMSLAIAQGLVLAQSIATVNMTLRDGAPEPMHGFGLSEFETFLRVFG